MLPRPPRATRTDTLFPYTTLFRSWSDLPFIVLTQGGGGPERNPGASRLSEALGSVTFLERPFHSSTFVSVARTALKGRRSEEHTSELQSLMRISYAVFCLKTKNKQTTQSLHSANTIHTTRTT